MALGLDMDAAFDDGDWVFAAPLVVTQLARGVLTATHAPNAAAAPEPLASSHLDAGLRTTVHHRCRDAVRAAVVVCGAAAAIDVTGIWRAPGRTRG